MSRILSTVGIAVPEDFAFDSYEIIHSDMQNKKENNEFAWEQYSVAWNAVAYRFSACYEYSISFTKSFHEFGASPPPIQRFEQEKEIFNFFVTGLSTIESFCYAAYMIGACFNSEFFPVQSKKQIETEKILRNIKPEKCAKQYMISFPLEGITQQLDLLIKDNKFNSWTRIRNILAHRTAPGRKHFLTLPLKNLRRDGSTVWIEGIQINENTTRIRFQWLCDALKILLDKMSEFTQKHTPN